jgi:addiction module HigA family antidote
MKALKMKNPAHPGFLIRVDCLEPFGLSVTDGAEILGVSRSALSNLVNKKADLSWDMAIRLSKAFGGTPEGWMRIQFQYDAAKVEERAKKIRVKPFEGEAILVQ